MKLESKLIFIGNSLGQNLTQHNLVICMVLGRKNFTKVINPLKSGLR
jgi:hypothetical protein